MLQNCKIITLFLLGLPLLATAAASKPFLGSSEGCQVERIKIEKSFKTSLKCGSFKYETEQEFLDNKFLKWATLKTKKDTLVVLIFTKGVHGEKAEVFSLKNKKKIKSIASSWPIEVSQKRMEYKLDSNEKGEYPSHFFDFKDY
ncbi:MAG: hypothetical protein ACJAT2_000295 [Bacteriovoracaceae bacterium]